jgi:hypothetical protein
MLAKVKTREDGEKGEAEKGQRKKPLRRGIFIPEQRRIHADGRESPEKG